MAMAGVAVCRAIMQRSTCQLSCTKLDDFCWPVQVVQEPNSKAQHVVLHAGPRTQEDGSSSEDEEQEEPAERHAECSFARDFRTCVESAGGECSSIGHAACSPAKELWTCSHSIDAPLVSQCTSRGTRQCAVIKRSGASSAQVLSMWYVWEAPALMPACHQGSQLQKPSGGELGRVRLVPWRLPACRYDLVSGLSEPVCAHSRQTN